MRRCDLVLLHGQPGLGSDWAQLLDRLPAQVREHAIAMDRPGHGANPAPGGDLDVSADAVIAELDAAGVERAVLVGHSYGGGVALRVAARFPDRVSALILLASVGPDCLNGWDRLLAAPLAGPVCSLFAWRLTPWAARAVLRWLGRKDGPDEAARRHANLYVWGHTRWDHGPLWRTFLAEQRALLRGAGELAAVAPRITAPVLLLADPGDPMVPLRTAQALAALLPDARLRLISGAGHHLPLRAPDKVASEMVAFLAEVGSPAT